VLRYSPDEADLRATQRKLEALWAAIEKSRAAGHWRPRPSRLCDWCRHKALCPEFGGTLPPLPGQQAPALAIPATEPATLATEPAIPGTAPTDPATDPATKESEVALTA
jgi:putative RecB family exonuclease